MTLTLAVAAQPVLATAVAAVPCGDVNGDGVVDIGDALVVAQFDVGLISCAFTCGPFTCPFTTSTTTSTTTTTSLVLLSTDPYTDQTSQHQTEVEPDTFAFGNTVVSALQVGRFFDGGASNIGFFATSTDGGNSFADGFLPGPTPSQLQQASMRASVMRPLLLMPIMRSGSSSYLGIFPAGNTSEVEVLVSRSMDGGLTWSNPVVVKADGDFNDKDWTVCDNMSSSPFYGNCYTEFDDFYPWQSHPDEHFPGWWLDLGTCTGHR